jgi:predicted enzyme related to lactoylglutathione lyase
MTHHRSRVLQFVIDVDDLDRGVAFWSAALDATEEPLSERSRPIYRLLRLPDAEIRVLLQRTDDEKVAKERMHLDLETDDIEAEVRRLEGLGATRSDHQQERGFDFWVLRDPWGNEFCVLHPNFPELLAPTPTMDQLGRVCNVTPAPARLLRWSPDPGWAADP